MTAAERARAEMERIKAKYTRPDQQQYLTLLIAAWEYHIAILERQQHDDRQRSNFRPDRGTGGA